MSHGTGTSGTAVAEALSLSDNIVLVTWCQARVLLNLSWTLCYLAMHKSHYPSPLLQTFLALFLSTVKNETRSCSENVLGAEILQLSVYCKGNSHKRVYTSLLNCHPVRQTLASLSLSFPWKCVEGCTAAGQQMVELLLWEMGMIISLLPTWCRKRSWQDTYLCWTAGLLKDQFCLLDRCQWRMEMHYS